MKNHERPARDQKDKDSLFHLGMRFLAFLYKQWCFGSKKRFKKISDINSTLAKYLPIISNC